ncbi:CAV1-like protein [Mya arenaria]|uniref:CAV1-like protein n=1 Tax=Mya arenaria TaxID=6604 RepID=A0ABY7EU79_MYAAR|nr:CAV1-like protein [Mya arenaria]
MNGFKANAKVYPKTARGTSHDVIDQAGPLPKKKPKPEVIVVNDNCDREAGSQFHVQLPDLDDRDPRGLNNHVKINFEDVLAEPRGVRSFSSIWGLSNSCYLLWNRCCYLLASLICAVPLATLYGLQFALTTSVHIWWCTPIQTIQELLCVHCLGKCVRLCVGCIVTPCTEGFGQIFHAFGDSNYNSKSSKSNKKQRPRVTFHTKVQYRTIPKREEPTMKEVLGQRKLVMSRMRMPAMVIQVPQPDRDRESDSRDICYVEEIND